MILHAWAGRKLRVNYYSVWTPGVATGLMHATRGWDTVRNEITTGWKGLAKDAAEIWNHLTNGLR